MKVALLTHSWGHPWIRTFEDAFKSRGHDYLVGYDGRYPGADCYLHAWADGSTRPVDGAINIQFVRRYEVFEPRLITKIMWDRFDHVITLNPWIENIVRRIMEDSDGNHGKRCNMGGDLADPSSNDYGNMVQSETQGSKSLPEISVIYNAVDSSKWAWKNRGVNTSTDIGMACHVHYKKNLPLAASVLSYLPPSFSLHIAGEVQDLCTLDYLNYIGKRMQIKIIVYGRIPSNKMDLWWEDKGFCLSSSISEGCPNNVLEAMAKGIKPVVHTWPGAGDLFGPDIPVHLTAVDMADDIMYGDYNSVLYRQLAGTRFGLENNMRIVSLVETIYGGKNEPGQEKTVWRNYGVPPTRCGL